MKVDNEAQEKDFSTLVGKTLREAKQIAKQHGCYIRVNSKGDEVFWGTQDYREERLNVDISKEEIVMKYNGRG